MGLVTVSLVAKARREVEVFPEPMGQCRINHAGLVHVAAHQGRSKGNNKNQSHKGHSNDDEFPAKLLQHPGHLLKGPTASC